MEVETSIVIRTLNEGRHIGHLLEGIGAQAYRAWETIIVDSGSTDATPEIARRYTPNIHHITKEQFTFGRSLNLGCRQARGRFLVFVSAHTYPLNDAWLGNLIRPFEDSSIAMVYGRQRGVGTSRISEQRDLERLFGLTSKILIDEPVGHNGNAAIRQGLWLEQPFDEALTGLEDMDWARKIQQLGYRVYYAAEAAVHHVHEESLGQVYRRFFREGVARRRMFPGYRFDRVDLIKEVGLNVLADAVFGIRRGKPARQLLQIPATRVAENLGKWRGLSYHRRLSRAMLLKLYYPKLSESVVITEAGKHGVEQTEVAPIGPDEVLIQVAYVGVCSTDLEVAAGELEYYREGHARYPVVPGHEYSGVVVEAGSNVRFLRKGDKVVGECAIGCGTCPSCDRGEDYCCASRKEVGVVNMNGAYARHLKVPGRYVHKLPRGMLLKEATLIEPLAVCLKGLRKLEAASGANACVVGAGPLGNLCAQLLRHRGVGATVVDQDERRLRLLYKYDINVRTALGSLDAFDYLIDASGDEAVIPALIQQSKPSVKILLLGLPYARPVSVDFGTVPCYDKTILGSIASGREDWEEAIRVVEARAVNLDDHTATVLPLESYEVAWKAVQERERFKVLLTCNAGLDGF